MFRNRQDAARQLAARFKDRPLRDPLVLAIPRGGVVTGAVLAQELNAELDVVLSRKLRAPGHAELALGAICEEGITYLNTEVVDSLGVSEGYLTRESEYQLAEIGRRRHLFRDVRPPARITGRSVLVTDDGIATGSTMIAALQSLRARQPHELIVAVPVAPPDRLEQLGALCDEVVCLLAPRDFWAVGQFYRDFRQVEDDEAVQWLRERYEQTAPGEREALTP